MKSSSSDLTYYTGNKYLSAYLICKGVDLLGAELDGRSITLRFPKPMAEPHIKTFYQNPSIPLQDYLKGLEQTIDIIMATKRGQHDQRPAHH